MATKVKDLIEIAKQGIECEILSGAVGYIPKALAGEKGLGTIIRPSNQNR
jgi:isopentenyl phosphate kinase